MKYFLLTMIFSLGFWSCNGINEQNSSDSQKEQGLNEEAENRPDDAASKQDSIQYSIHLDKAVYSVNEPIVLTLTAKNMTNKELRFWIDPGRNPADTELTLIDSTGKSMVEDYWCLLSSHLYLPDEIEKLKTRISPGGEFKKSYRLLSIIRLKRDLSKGTYVLGYNNAKPVKFVIK